MKSIASEISAPLKSASVASTFVAVTISILVLWKMVPRSRTFVNVVRNRYAPEKSDPVRSVEANLVSVKFAPLKLVFVITLPLRRRPCKLAFEKSAPSIDWPIFTQSDQSTPGAGGSEHAASAVRPRRIKPRIRHRVRKTISLLPSNLIAQAALNLPQMCSSSYATFRTDLACSMTPSVSSRRMQRSVRPHCGRFSMLPSCYGHWPRSVARAGTPYVKPR